MGGSKELHCLRRDLSRPSAQVSPSHRVAVDNPLRPRTARQAGAVCDGILFFGADIVVCG